MVRLIPSIKDMRRLKKEKLDSFSKLEEIRETEKEKSVNQRIEDIILKKFEESGFTESMKDVNSKLCRIMEKMEELVFLYETNSRKNMTPTRKKIKMKETIRLMFQQHGSLTAAELSRMMKLSRTRCSEYIKELEKEGVLSGRVKCRKKVYKIRQ